MSHPEIGLDRPGSLDEECHRRGLRESHEIGQASRVEVIGQRQRGHGELVLGSHMQDLPTRHQHLKLRAGGYQVGHLHSCAHDLLEVVQQ